MSKMVHLELKKALAIVTLKRPKKKNALTFEMLKSLSDIGESLKHKSEIRCVILQGCDGVFCSGIDITSFASLANDRQFLKTIMAPLDGKPYNQMQMPCMIWKELEVPVIAVLEGPVFGAGLQLALGADIRIAASDAILSVMETKWGLIPDMGITQNLPQLMNYDTALYVTLTSKLINANESKNLGLITVCSEDPYQSSVAWAERILTKSPDAIRFTKSLYKKAWTNNTPENLKLEALLQTHLIGSPNQMEAVLANIEKRNPKFLCDGQLNAK